MIVIESSKLDFMFLKHGRPYHNKNFYFIKKEIYLNKYETLYL